MKIQVAQAAFYPLTLSLLTFGIREAPCRAHKQSCRFESYRPHQGWTPTINGVTARRDEHLEGEPMGAN